MTLTGGSRRIRPRGVEAEEANEAASRIINDSRKGTNPCGRVAAAAPGQRQAKRLAVPYYFFFVAVRFLVADFFFDALFLAGFRADAVATPLRRFGL